MSGWTGVYVALKVAYYMGFSTILLVGVDHTSDWEHFTDDYPVGDQMTDYRFEGQREHFQLTNDTFGGDNKKILNLSPPSPLDTIIERGNINDWM